MLVKHLSILLVLISIAHSDAQETSGAANRLSDTDHSIAWFRDAKFGVLITWGPVSIKGTEIGFSRANEPPGEVGGKPGTISANEYDGLYKQFSPTDFDAKEWVGLFRDAGTRYVVFMTRASDGFCMFDTKLADYKITKSPIGRDLTAEIVKACHEVRMPVGFYYSPGDCRYPPPAFPSENHQRCFIPSFHSQVRELCSNYGKIDLLWFDGVPNDPKFWGSNDLFRMIRQLQPAIVINDRAGLPGDFETREGKIGGVQMDRPWETVEILGSQWAWKPNDVTHNPQEVIQLLVKCVGRDGNLLMNVGPMASGQLDPNQVKCLRQVGSWLKKYGESIYGARGGPYLVKPLGCDWADAIGVPTNCAIPGPYIDEDMVSTRKGNIVYLHVLNWKEGSLVLPSLGRKVIASSVLTGGTVEVTASEHNLKLSVPPDYRNAIDTIIKLKLDDSAETIPFIRPDPLGSHAGAGL